MMTNGIIIDGFLKEITGVKYPIPEVLNPSDSYIENTIKKIYTAGYGAITLRFDPMPKIGPKDLDLQVDGKNLLLILSFFDERGSYNFKTINNLNSPSGSIIILGDGYPSYAVTQDIDLVCKAFIEYAHTGDVSWMIADEDVD